MRPSPIARFVTALACALALGAAASAQPAPLSPAEGHAAADTSSDGVVDRGEYHLRMVEIFYLSDDDRDGYLVIAEIGRVPASDFAAADANSDGKLSLREYVDVRFGEFERLDTDRDGVISRPEVRAAP